MDRGMPCRYATPFDGDVLMWEKADVLHRQRRSLDPTTFSDFGPHVKAPKVHNGASENNISQLTKMMSHLCQRMQAFAQVLKSGNPAASETSVSQPTAAHCVPPKTEIERMPSPGRVSDERPQACGTPSVSTGRKNIMKPQLFDGNEPINSFLAHFEVCAELNQWSTKEKLAWLQWSLKGRAQQVLWDLPAHMLSSYEDIVKTLRQRLGLEHQSEVYTRTHQEMR